MEGARLEFAGIVRRVLEDGASLDEILALLHGPIPRAEALVVHQRMAKRRAKV